MKTSVFKRPRLNALLSSTADYPLVSLVAGAGFGKTTAAREYLRMARIPFAWVAITGSDEAVLWDNLCDAIEPHSHAVADQLRIIGLPADAWAVSCTIKLARESCTQPFIVCLDDCHLLAHDSPLYHLIEALAFEEIDNLHILLLSRAQPNIRLETLATKQLTFNIGSDELRFTASETKEYLAMRGLRLSSTLAETICNLSDGWISAIYLISEGMRTSGELQHGRINMLFEENLLRPLAEIDREMLYRLSAFDCFPIDMAVYALGMERVRDVVDFLVRENAFITCDDRGVYRMHPLLRGFLASHCPHDELQKALLKRAGTWYLLHLDNQRPPTLGLFVQAGCVEEFLALANEPSSTVIRFSDIEELSRIASDLPKEYCLRYPFPYLRICFFLMLTGKRSSIRFARVIYQMMEDHFSQHEHPYRNRILGELLIIARVNGFGQFEGPDELLEQASHLLDGQPSITLSPFDPFTFGLPFLLHSEFMTAGTLDESVSRCQHNPYELVTDGFGRGSEQLVQAEAALLRCQFDEAKPLALQALKAAEAKQQFFVMASARFVLMRRALFLGDVQAATDELDHIGMIIPLAKHVSQDMPSTEPMLRELLLFAECFLGIALRKWDDVPSDFLDGTHVSAMVSGLGVVQVFEARALYASGNPAGALRVCDQMSDLHAVCQIARLHGLVLSALANEQFYNNGRGVKRLVLALREGEMDDIVLVFAENPDILPLLDKPAVRDAVGREYLARVRASCEAYRSMSIAANTDQALPRLSARETEVLRLIAAGNTRMEAASVLCVRESTIKAHLASVYRKLGAKGKVDAIRLARLHQLI